MLTHHIPYREQKYYYRRKDYKIDKQGECDKLQPMIKAYILTSVFLLLFLTTLPNATAQESTGLPVKEAACEALQDKEIYKKKRLNNYKLMMAGENEWAFRSIVSFKKDFSINDKTLGYIQMLQKGFRAHGTEFIMLLPPSRSLVHFDNISESDKVAFNFTQADQEKAWSSYRNTIKNLKDNNIHVVGVEELPTEGDFYYKRDHHWSPYGARLTANKLADYIKTLPVYDDLKKKDFQTKEVGIIDYDGTFSKAFEKICGTELIPEKIAQFKTEQAQDAQSADALFAGDTPEVVLLGTSNSAAHPNVSNFDGFLKEALRLDIDNKAFAGAGIDSSIISYLNSAEFKEAPPKVIIWEVPGYYNVNRMNDRVFLQAIPAAYGSCAESAVVSENQIIEKSPLALFSNLASKDIKGLDYYLNFEFDQPVTEPFDILLSYEEYKDSQKFKRSKRYPTPDGKYFVMLRFDNKGPLQKVVMNVPDELIGRSVTARVCKSQH